MPTRFGANSRSFTCLLKEIDEEEEKNVSLPGSKIAPTTARQGNLASHETSNGLARGIDPQRKSRNAAAGGSTTQRNNTGTLDGGAGSTVIYGTAVTTGQTGASFHQDHQKYGMEINT